MKTNTLILIAALIMAHHAFSQNSIKAIDTKKIDATLASYCKSDEPGMAIGIVHNGKAIYKNAQGLANLTHNIPLTDSTTFNIASASKQFTAYLTLLAEDEEKISLEDDIRKYLPELGHLPHKITIEQLANHTHGLPNYSELIAVKGFGLESPITNAQAMEIVLNIQHPNFKAGSQFQYGNTGFMLLAEILERVYDTTFPALIQEKIFTPFQMEQSTVIGNQNIIIKNKARAYTKTGDSYVEFMGRNMEYGSSTIHTSLGDMLKWIRHFQNPTTKNQLIFNQMTLPTTVIDAGQFTYGLGLYAEKYKGIDMVFHGGGTAGYRAYVLHVPEHKLSIVTLANQAGFDGLLIIYDLLELFLKDHLIESIPQKQTYSTAELKAFEGTYEFNPGNYASIEAKDNNLYFEGDSNPLPIIGDEKFVFPYQPTAYLTFKDNQMQFRIADMLYNCKKVDVNPPTLTKAALRKYIGHYKNETLNTYYEILLKDDHLIAKNIINRDFTLHPLSENTFYTAYPLGELRFESKTSGEIDGFVLSGQNMGHIAFKKLN